MPRVPLHYVDLRTFCYATEDEKRVEEALRSFLPDEFELDRVENVGHHGDRIVVLSARLERADEMRHVLGRVSELEDIERVLTELDGRVDDNCSLFLRLDKQAAFRDEVRLGPGITLRAKVEAYPAKKPRAVETAREVIAGLAGIDPDELDTEAEDSEAEDSDTEGSDAASTDEPASDEA